MTLIGPLGFTAPWLLFGLLALPLLWWLLRAVPPAPVRRHFPGVALLLGLADASAEAERTPWWLLALRILALAAAIIGFAGPVLHPAPVAEGQGPLLIVEDGSWASAADWPRRIERISRALDEAAAAGRPVALVNLAAAPAAPPPFAKPATLARSLPGFLPRPWEPAVELDPALLLPEGRFDTLWLSDGLDRVSRAPLLAALRARGAVRVWQPATPVLALAPVVLEGAALRLQVLASAPSGATPEVVAIGPDPSGQERELARLPVPLGGTRQGVGLMELPPELRNRVSRFELAGLRSAAAVRLGDDTLKRRKVALVSAVAPREGLELLAATHYLRQALAPSADLIEGTLADALLASPDVLVLADLGEITEAAALQAWVEKGGLLLRFAGPRLAAAQSGDDPLLPVRLRQGGRSVGGTMSWGEPRQLAPFAEGSPFAGLTVPDEVTVRAQVLAEPGPDLAEATLATLADGTPLVTRKPLGQGMVVLFHVTANAEWSNLPLSGLFPQMLERLAVAARPGGAAAGDLAADLAGQTWVALRLLDAFGQLNPAQTTPGVAGQALAEGPPGPDLPPGLYAGGERVVALDALPRGRQLAAPDWPADLVLEAETAPRPRAFKGVLLAIALAALMLDLLAALWLSGRLRGARVAALLVLLLAPMPRPLQAEPLPLPPPMPETRAIAAADNVVLAYVPSGDARLDAIAKAGLSGLGEVLRRRTTIEPSAPMALDLETDDLALFTLIYWPVAETAPSPSPAAYARLNRYLRAGGMILFDSRDADLAGLGTATATGRRLQALAAPLEVPPLEPVPADHVLTRSFYLLQTMPGRFDGPVWVEAAPADAEQAEGVPFRNLNDGVSPVVIGGNDWASAWAIDEAGRPMLPLGRGAAGERQRELAYRFGVNLVMHVLTGNYKSDQVHVPALLERLGQ